MSSQFLWVGRRIDGFDFRIEANGLVTESYRVVISDGRLYEVRKDAGGSVTFEMGSDRLIEFGSQARYWDRHRVSAREVQLGEAEGGWRFVSKSLMSSNLTVNCYAGDELVFELRGLHFSEGFTRRHLRNDIVGDECVGVIHAELSDHLPALLFGIEKMQYGHPDGS